MSRIAASWILPLLLDLGVSAQQPQPRLVHLDMPDYPPLAIAARITGPVEMELTIAPDGTVKSSRAVSGPPLLIPVVTDSLAKARFVCEGCGQPEYTYRVTYDFHLPADGYAKECEEMWKTGKEPAMPPSTLDSPTHVTVRPLRLGPGCPTSDPATPRKRSARCLWLWKCSI
jgi:hypothetical protein